ncbi:MFS transporter [Natronoarchaeum mannanilyticum]|uniref:MFS transporter n=1 Tax=Natronoarchaeum mannanilyticum TaxID=926360 RepID=A0AAV3TA33_9EURY
MSRRWLYAWGLGSAAFGAASLLVPLYVVTLGGGPADLGYLAAAAAFLGAPGAIVWGRLADRTTRRREVAVASLAGVAAVLAATPLLGGTWAVIVANAVLWLLVAAAGPVLTLLVVADAPESAWSREIGLLNAYQGYGWAAGLVLGLAWTAVVGRTLDPATAQRTLFWASAACAGAAAVGMARWMPRPAERSVARVDPRRVARTLGASRRNVRSATFAFAPNRLYWSTRAIHPRRLAERFTPALAGYFLAAVLFFTGFAAFWAPLPLFLTDAGYGGDAVFGLYLVSSLGSAAFYVGAGRLSAEYDLRGLQIGALGVRGVTLPAVAVVGALGTAAVGVGLTALAFAVIGVAWAVISVTATTIVTRLAPTSLRGEALGVYAALSALAGGVGSVAGGWLAAGPGFSTTFAVAGALVLAGAVLIGLLREISARTAMATETMTAE